MNSPDEKMLKIFQDNLEEMLQRLLNDPNLVCSQGERECFLNFLGTYFDWDEFLQHIYELNF